MAKDVVCGMDVDEKTAAAKSEYRGTTYYFCSASCKKACVVANSPTFFSKAFERLTINVQRLRLVKSAPLETVFSKSIDNGPFG